MANNTDFWAWSYVKVVVDKKGIPTAVVQSSKEVVELQNSDLEKYYTHYEVPFKHRN